MIAPSKEVLMAVTESIVTLPAGLTAAHGTALYVGAVLGTAVIALPALGARAAGPASLLAWLGLVLLSIALATTFAALGARYPDAGGVSTYVRRAFGARAAAVAGWCFYLAAIPAGAPAAGMFAGGYVAAAVDGGGASVLATAAGLMATVTVANLLGIQVSARLQLALVGLLAALLAVAAATSLPHARLSNLHPLRRTDGQQLAPPRACWCGVLRAGRLSRTSPRSSAGQAVTCPGPPPPRWWWWASSTWPSLRRPSWCLARREAVPSRRSRICWSGGGRAGPRDSCGDGGAVDAGGDERLPPE
jgi:hypothetical protein